MKRSAIPFLVTIILTGCGIDRGGAPLDTPVGAEPDGTLPRPALIVGVIADKDADTVTVNDSVIAVNNALFEVDEATSALDLIDVGQYAVIDTTQNTNGAFSASSVVIDSQAIGPVSAFDAASNTLTVLGQQIIIDADTVLDASVDGVDFSDTAALGNVRASGIANGSGNIQATFLATAPGASLRLTGFATNIDEATSQFAIGAQTVNYANAAVIDLPSTAPGENERVTVTGVVVGTEFMAMTLTSAPLQPNPSSGGVVALTAVVTESLVDGAFSAGFVPAQISSDTFFNGGGEADLITGTLVTVRGIQSAGGVVLVSSIQIAAPP